MLCRTDTTVDGTARWSGMPSLGVTRSPLRKHFSEINASSIVSCKQTIHSTKQKLHYNKIAESWSEIGKSLSKLHD